MTLSPVLVMYEVVYKACQDILGLRLWVEENLEYPTGAGNLWLPVVLTAKGPLYGEVIGLAEEFSTQQLSEDLVLIKDADKKIPYRQPIHLSNALRQPLYYLSFKLLQYLSAPSAVYLVQFAIKDSEIIFDRLWPFPAAPAIASVGVQQPDLFTCHWYCLTGKPIKDLIIFPE